MFPIQKIVQRAPEYPDVLKEIHDPPKQLFARGNSSLLNNHTLLAIVGTRKCSTYGRSATQRIVEELRSTNAVIVSGLAFGIDAAAHKAALENSLPTIAVLGGSVDDTSIYPQTNKGLATKILEKGGLIISEYETGTETFPSNFLNRNRIIAGISQGTLVVEAPIKSGALSTARHALNSNRSVYAIPGNISSRLSTGTNYLIQQGAMCVTTAQDIISDLPLELLTEREQQDISILSPDEQHLIHILESSSTPLHINTIIQTTNWENQKVVSTLLSLVLGNYITEVEQNSYQRIP
ncbi:MAG: DNA-protecting protein DprA [Candidatus Spechtbacteria bacterium SB0662_bin_43]|uniref:DNA-protecting protein DprA n=1 Tax=Candidatus Spechtbacteria bacterium SB0662_bin_43 TaxID=2604897 RepID=A0A845D9T5_9BACT|nr:DNA-protecting protein DprA [Candidatus Spechtbacteria bacterium SB0662_bin_43]